MEAHMSELKDRVAVITGASGNLGRAVAKKLINFGSKLALVDRHIEILQDVYKGDFDPENTMFIAPADVLDKFYVDTMVTNILNRFSKIDILVNTVGGYRAGTPTHETSLEAWDFMLNLNARSVFITSSAVIPAMLKQNTGKIVNIASRAALIGSANAAAYSVSKSAVIKITESMSAELKSSSINVNCIIPGTLDTSQNRQAMPEADFASWVDPDSIADVILFLASDASRDIHGAAIPVYGLS
jgi:NAD(P)-dependent dehydrogenase (short-subunit alcohol dehydrogenase family)